MDTKNNRNLILGGGFSAVLACLFLMSACGGPGGGGPQPDAGPMADDGGLPPPDAGTPLDSPADGGDGDAGITPDAGAPDPDGGMACTSDMLLMRVSPPCDPDTNPAVGPGMAPTGAEDHIGPGHEWNSPTSSGFTTGWIMDPMGRIGIGMRPDEADIAPYNGRFYYSADGVWTANWANKDVSGVQGNHARIVFAADHRTATLEVFDGGSDVPSATVPLWET